MFKYNKHKRGKHDTPRSIGEVVNDYFLHGENPLAIAYRRRKGQEVCGTVINSNFQDYGRQ